MDRRSGRYYDGDDIDLLMEDYLETEYSKMNEQGVKMYNVNKDLEQDTKEVVPADVADAAIAEAVEKALEEKEADDE